MTKICCRCKKELPRTIDFFNRSKTKKDGLRCECKECQSEDGKKYYKDNIEKVKQYRADNAEIISRKRKQYHKDNLKKILKYAKQYRKEHAAGIKEKHEQYRRDHREELARYLRQYRKDNVDKITEHRRLNLGKDCIKSQKRRSLKRNLESTLTPAQWEKVKRYFNNCCAYCGKEKPLTQEHFVPLTKDGEYTHNNIIPACQVCNSSKSDSSFFEWYSKSEHYSKQREQQILKYLNYKNDVQQFSLAL